MNLYAMVGNGMVNKWDMTGTRLGETFTGDACCAADLGGYKQSVILYLR